MLLPTNSESQTAEISIRIKTASIHTSLFTINCLLCGEEGDTKLNPLKGTLEPQSNGPLDSSTVLGTLAADGWAVTFGTARRGLGGLRPRPVPSSLYQM